MARNKYPERTVEKILQVSLKLFNEKGYEKTTIQDIVNELGMSKGAIYHHFKSKEEIVEAISQSCYHNNQTIPALLQDSSKSGLEKLQLIIMSQMSDETKKDVDTLSLNLWKNPKIFMMSMKENLDVNAKLVETILEEGIQDGSITVEEPHYTAQILMLLLNYWVYSPTISDVGPETIGQRIHYLRKLCVSIGVDLINDEIEQKLTAYFKMLYART